jgi:hypothetical protein
LSKKSIIFKLKWHKKERSYGVLGAKRNEKVGGNRTSRLWHKKSRKKILKLHTISP